MDILNIKNAITGILAKYGVVFAGVFGSVARGEATAESDVDLLVEFSHTQSLVKLIRFENELAGALQKKVDIVLRGSEKKLVKPFIEKDLIQIYG